MQLKRSCGCGARDRPRVRVVGRRGQPAAAVRDACESGVAVAGGPGHGRVAAAAARTAVPWASSHCYAEASWGRGPYRSGAGRGVLDCTTLHSKLSNARNQERNRIEALPQPLSAPLPARKPELHSAVALAAGLGAQLAKGDKHPTRPVPCRSHRVLGQLLVAIDQYRGHYCSRWSGWIAAVSRAITSATENSPDGPACEIRLNTPSIRL